MSDPFCSAKHTNHSFLIQVFHCCQKTYNFETYFSDKKSMSKTVYNFGHKLSVIKTLVRIFIFCANTRHLAHQRSQQMVRQSVWGEAGEVSVRIERIDWLLAAINKEPKLIRRLVCHLRNEGLLCKCIRRCFSMQTNQIKSTLHVFIERVGRREHLKNGP